MAGLDDVDRVSGGSVEGGSEEGGIEADGGKGVDREPAEGEGVGDIGGVADECAVGIEFFSTVR